MKRTVLLLLTGLAVLLAAGCGKNKDTKKQTPDNPEQVTETPTEEPALREYTEYYAGTVNCVNRGAGGKVWTCKGTMTFSSHGACPHKSRHGGRFGPLHACRGRAEEGPRRLFRGREVYGLLLHEPAVFVRCG